MSTMNKRTLAYLIAISVSANAGCDAATEPGNEVIRLGELHPSSAVSMPDTVQVGEPFDVVIVTWGNGCLLGPARADVTQSGTRVEIAPFDRWVVTRGNLVCTDEEVTAEHVVELTFQQTGQHRVVVRALQWPEGSETDVERSITVIGSA